MITDSEREKIKKWGRKFFSEAGEDYQAFDFNSEIDSSLSVEENKNILREKIRSFLNIYNQEAVKKMKKSEAEIMPKDAYEHKLDSDIKKQEENAKLEFFNSLQKITDTKTSSILDSHFYILRHYVNMVCTQNATGLICEGEAGMGKSFNILKALKDSGREFVYCSGFTTTLELYNFLYENKEKIIFFDDTKNIFKSEASLEILKASMFSPTGVRIVKYLSSTPKLKAPNQFIFNGGIIVAINELNKKSSEDLKAVIDRVLYLNIRFSYMEKLSIIAELIKHPYKELSEDERRKVFEFIKDRANESTQNLNFRLLYKLYEIYRYNKEEFEKLAEKVICNNEQLSYIIQLLKHTSTMKDAEKEFSQKTGYSRRTFYDLKKRANL